MDPYTCEVSAIIQQNASRIGKLQLGISLHRYHNCVTPKLVQEGIIMVKSAIEPLVEQIRSKKHQRICIYAATSKIVLRKIDPSYPSFFH
ncbi:hypothetical protein GYMLUDRAFT_691941 [Collybiopsis luxurians FD-317 M1]|uniref:Uncharacterized protein n=1 Tax=Collybiopsis luxurians FD-317 M1 TaxID=944289 RepID=A0A0D0CSB8_9AGAR|nr:hypothetical protein GYMLUDRAFT_691941 [Collybiopsis luxurians FD-317 M1]